ncbi:murein tripeptide amidase MpaA [Sphingomonas jejuensis]|uniref:Murein tripeptide amidase MpaA n=1 Tax=Sphingomonas jejuensis TaxID=904715 RepID=A0ABX0XP77_9SPHN|nr:M14-type cytosolic carboxypeptidase [Sphingomonas jejuensis]NJC34532.1 murein tripeptide amidase MpaA [Sphingomonas jejuensis]
MSLEISAAFDGGNIRVLGIDGDRADLEIVADTGSDFYQWFYFRVAGARGRPLELRITNCRGAAYAFGWPGYRARVSTDRENWRQAETSFDGDVLTIRHTGDADVLWVAYFAPYSMDRHHDLVARIAAHDGVRVRELTRTLDGQPLDMLTLGDGPKQLWFYARQHPGETMAEWWMEGALEKLVDPADAAARTLREKATIHLVPNMNPDGSRRGHLRTNAIGVNLNREWHDPSPGRSPEVFAVRAAMDETGVDFAIDVHGDEAIAANFFAGFEGIPSLKEDRQRLYTRYAQALAAYTPDFQLDLGYPVSAPGTANLSMSTAQVAERFGAVAMTLEMPFKDHDANADPDHGWSPDRSKRLAHACLDVLAGMIDEV